MSVTVPSDRGPRLEHGPVLGRRRTTKQEDEVDGQPQSRVHPEASPTRCEMLRGQGIGWEIRFHHTGGTRGTKIRVPASNRYTNPVVGLETTTVLLVTRRGDRHGRHPVRKSTRGGWSHARVQRRRLYMCVREDALASVKKEEEAKKYTEQLRKSKDAKTKITALQELEAPMRTDQEVVHRRRGALPDVYKAVGGQGRGCAGRRRPKHSARRMNRTIRSATSS